MTVCIAAIFQDNCVINAADRMISAGDGAIRYEPDSSKIFRLTNCETDTVILMTAGDLSLQAEIIEIIQQKIRERESKKRLGVKEAVDDYCDAYREIYFRRAESAILVPQCLTLKSYFEKQKKGELSETLITYIANQLANFKLDSDVETIISGIDDYGTHIYVIRNDQISCETNTGYAAIGGGGWHAESQFMFAKYTMDWHITEALFLTYKAKRRAEVAEGIGEETDMVMLFSQGSQPQNFIPFEGKRLREFDRIYQILETNIVTNEQVAKDYLRKQYEEAVEASRHKKKADAVESEAELGSETINEENIRDSLETS